jgi:hypothetical protein
MSMSMQSHFRVRAVVVAFAILAAGALAACTASGPGNASGRAGTGGAAGATGTAGTSGGAGAAGTGATAGTTGAAGSGTTTGAAGAGGAAGNGTVTGAAGTGGSTGAAGTGSGPDAGAGGTGGTTTPDAAAGDGPSSPPFDAAGRTPPTCKAPKPSPIPSMKPTNECDYLLQSVDFEDNYSYATPASSIHLTSFGTAMGLFEINNCSPYCYSKALTVGIDIVGGGDAKALQGEIIVKFPDTGGALPITTAVGRDSLAWIMLDGPTAPPFKITAQLVVENATGTIPAVETRQLGYANWLDYQHAEFKYFPVTATTFTAPPTNLTGIGFRIMAPANLPKGMEWHGVAYIDHLQIRAGQPKDPPGAYPYGL